MRTNADVELALILIGSTHHFAVFRCTGHFRNFVSTKQASLHFWQQRTVSNTKTEWFFGANFYDLAETCTLVKFHLQKWINNFQMLRRGWNCQKLLHFRPNVVPHVTSWCCFAVIYSCLSWCDSQFYPAIKVVNDPGFFFRMAQCKFRVNYL